MKKVLLKAGAPLLALTLITACGTADDENNLDDNNPVDQREEDQREETDDFMDENHDDQGNMEDDQPREDR